MAEVTMPELRRGAGTWPLGVAELMERRRTLPEVDTLRLCADLDEMFDHRL
jgi:hypothetical protein